MDLFGIGQAVSGITGAALSYKGAREANAMNKYLAEQQMGFQDRSNKEAMAFSRESAREQMGFQERMSNTAYQRSVEDMKAAGVNPILAYNQGGASSPGGSSPGGVSSGGARAHVSNEFSGAVGSALQAMSVGAQVEQTRAMTELMRADLPERQKASEIYSGKGGSLLKWWKELMGPLAQTAKAAKDVGVGQPKYIMR